MKLELVKKLKSTFTDHISHKSSIKTTIVIKIQLKIAFLTDFQENNKRLHVSYFEWTLLRLQKLESICFLILNAADGLDQPRITEAWRAYLHSSA